MLFIVLLLSACSVFSPYHEEFYIKDLRVVYTDRSDQYCGGYAACYNIATKTIYCRRGDWFACGHELCHVTYQDYDHKKICTSKVITIQQSN